jgi:hypothetical protein
MHVILLRNYRNTGNGMNLHPLRVKRVLHIRSNDAHVRAYRGDCDLVLITLACRLGVWLRHRELAYDLEHQVTTFITLISSVQEILEFRIYLEPSVRISISFVTDAIPLFACGRVNNSTCHGGALLYHDKALVMVNVIP